jgi:hypothetical protein
MICYRCEHCGVDLESPDDLAGKQDKCPACGKACAVPTSQPGRAIRGFWIGAASGIVVAGAAAVVVGLLVIPRDKGNRYAVQEHEASTTQSQVKTVINSNLVPSSAESIGGLTGDDVITFAERHNMKALGGWRFDKDYKKVWDENFRTWERPDGLFISCAWFSDSAKKRIKKLFIGRMSVKHGLEGQSTVLQAWQELYPDMAPRFRRLFKKRMYSPLRWIGKSPYAYGVSANNKAFIDYIGPQSDIEVRRKYAIVAANIRISWYRYILSTQKKLAAKLKSPATPKQTSDAICKVMLQLEQGFKDVPLSVGFSMDYWAKQKVRQEPLSPMWIPEDLPEETRTLLHKTASEITAIARLTRFTVQRGNSPSFKPFNYMIMAFSDYSGVERSTWGEYARLEEFRGVHKELPPEQGKAIEEISLRGLSCLMESMGKK